MTGRFVGFTAVLTALSSASAHALEASDCAALLNITTSELRVETAELIEPTGTAVDQATRDQVVEPARHQGDA